MSTRTFVVEDPRFQAFVWLNLSSVWIREPLVLLSVDQPVANNIRTLYALVAVGLLFFAIRKMKDIRAKRLAQVAELDPTAQRVRKYEMRSLIFMMGVLFVLMGTGLNFLLAPLTTLFIGLWLYLRAFLGDKTSEAPAYLCMMGTLVMLFLCGHYFEGPRETMVVYVNSVGFLVAILNFATNLVQSRK